MERNPIFKLWESISKKESIVIAIDGKSYSCTDDSIRALSYLNDYDQFTILYISSQSNLDQDIGSITWAPRFRGHDEIEIRREKPKNYWGSGFEDPSVKEVFSIELIAAMSLGDLVVTQVDVTPHIKLLQKAFPLTKSYIGNLSECFSVMRAWINNQLKISIKKNHYSYSFSNWTNILIHFDLVTPHIKEIYRTITSLNNSKLIYNNIDISDYIHAISTRIIHIFNTRDILEVLKLNTFDSAKRNSINFSLNSKYYFEYLLILVTGILDAMGWVINWAMNRNTKNYYEITLRKSKEKHYGKFIKSLILYKKELANYIDMDEVQCFFELVFSIRNYIAHSTMTKRMSLMGNFQGLHGDLIYLDGSFEEMVLNYLNKANINISVIGIEIYKPSKNPKDNKILLDAVLFARFLVREIAGFTDKIYTMLPIQNKITEEEERIKYNNFKIRSSSRKISRSMESIEFILSSIETQIP